MMWNTRRAMLLGHAGPVFEKEGEEGSGGDGGTAGEAGEGDKGADAGEGDNKSAIGGGLLDRRNKDGDKGDQGGEGDKAPPADDGRPEGLADKFWDADKATIKTDALAKSYAELEAAHGKLKREKSVGGEVPESADDYFADGLDLDESVDRLAIDGPDDPGLKAWGNVCHKYGIGKELAVNLAKDMFGLMNEHAPEPLNPDAEYEALGKGADAVIDGVFTWVEGAEKSGRLSENDIQIVNGLSQTADGIKFLAAMRAMSGEERIPIIPATGQRGMSANDWNEAYKEAVASKDYKKQAELDAMSGAIFGEEPATGGRPGGVDPERNRRTRKSA